MKLTARANKPAKNYAYRRHMAALVRVRWERRDHRCEGCNLPTDVVECAHLFGRRNLIKEPYASDPALCAALCRDCHRAIDSNRDVELRDELRRSGIERFCGDHFLALPAAYITDPLAGIHEIERTLEARENQ